MKQIKKIFMSLFIFLSTLIYANENQINTIEDINKMVIESQSILPKSISKEMDLMEIIQYKDIKVLEYIIFFKDLTKEHLELVKFSTLLHDINQMKLCNNKTIENLFKLNYNVIYQYYDKNNEIFYTEKITPNFCKK